VVDPALKGVFQIILLAFTSFAGIKQAPELAAVGDTLPTFEQTMCGIEDEAEEGNTLADGPGLCCGFMDGQA